MNLEQGRSSEYQFAPQSWQMHEVADACPYELPINPRRTGFLTYDRQAALDANRAIDDFLNARPAEPVRTFRSGVELTVDMIPPGSIVEIADEYYLMEENAHLADPSRWGVVVRHKEYGTKPVPGIVTIPKTVIDGDRTKHVYPGMLQSVNKFETPPGYGLMDLPLHIGAVQHTRVHLLPQGDINSPDPQERFYAVRYPNAEDKNTLYRVTKVDLWFQGSPERKRSFSFANPLGRLSMTTK
jgi:hypothetical protein